MHYLDTCDAVMRVPPSKINSKAIVEEGVDHLSFVGHSARVCCPCRCKYHHHEEGFDCKDGHDKVKYLKLYVTLPSTSIVRTTVT